MRLGIRFKKTPKTDELPIAIPSRNMVQVFDADTGEEVKGVFDVKVRYGVDGVIKVDLRFYAAAQDMYE